MGHLEAWATGTCPPRGSLPARGAGPNRRHRFWTRRQGELGLERVGVKNVKQDPITIFILEKPSSKHVYLIRTIRIQEQKTD